MTFLQDWVDYLSEPRPETGGMPPCPFAQRAKITHAKADSQGALNYILNNIISVSPQAVLVIEIPQAVYLAAWANRHPRRDWIALESDPLRPVVIQGFQTTQREAKLILVQNASELLSYRQLLQSQGYFDNWGAEALERIGI
jgi:hypothetical protein